MFLLTSTLCLALALGPALREGAAGGATPSYAAQGDVRSALAQLEAPDAEVRRRAAGWLATHLETEDFPAVADAAANGGAEVLLRLGAAIGSDDRHLGLAALCFADEDATVRRIGKRAIEDLVVRWMGSVAGASPTPVGLFLGRLPTEPQRRFALTFGQRSLREEIELIDRAQRFDVDLGLPRFGLAIDPGLRGVERNGTVEGEPRRGTWVQLLASVVSREHLDAREPWALEVFSGQSAIWIRVLGPSADPYHQSAEWVIGRWVRSYLTTLDTEERLRIARALAGTGWPAILTWFERRWFEDGESAAFAALVHAAARGRCAPGLASEAGYEELVRAVDRSLAEPSGFGASTAELASALVAVGRLGAGGRSLTARLASDWARLGTPVRRVRLAILAASGGPPPELAQELRRAFAGDSALEPELAWLAVRALAALPSASALTLTADRARAVFAAAEADGARPDQIARTMVRAGSDPPAAWRKPGPLADDRARLGAFAWWLEVEELATSAAYLRALAQSGLELELGQLLTALRRSGRGAFVEALLVQAFGEPEGGAETMSAAGTRLAALAGVVDDLAARLLLESRQGRSVEDLTVLGALAARSGARAEAWERLVDHVRSPRTARVAWVAGLERALTDSLEAPDEAWAVLLQGRAQVLIGAGDPLAGALLAGAWPPGPGPGPPDLVRLEPIH